MSNPPPKISGVVTIIEGNPEAAAEGSSLSISVVAAIGGAGAGALVALVAGAWCIRRRRPAKRS